METTKQNKNGGETNNWKNIVQSFVSKILEQIGDNISERAHKFVYQLKKRTVGMLLMLIGCIFLLISAAMLINAVLGNVFPWVGWGLIGIISVAVGYIVIKD